MKKEKILKINFELKFDTLYVFHLKRNSSFHVIAKNVSFTIRTDQFGLAMYCFNVNKIRKTDAQNLIRFSIITNDCKSVLFNSFDNLMKERIRSFLQRKIKEATAKKRARKEKIRSFASQITRRFDKTKKRLIDLLNRERFSYSEFQKNYANKFDEICSYVTKKEHSVNINMKKSIILLLNQSNNIRAIA